MNLRDLRYIVAVADLRNFNRAAEACHVSQPSLSKQIQKLEQYLGVALFERTNRKVSVTPAGEAIVGHARQAIQEADAIRDIARSAGDPSAGSFRLGIIPTLAPYLLPHFLPRLQAAFPKLELTVREATTAQILGQLQHNELDAVIAALPLDAPDLIEHELAEEPFLLAVPAGHPLARLKRATVGSLGDAPLLLLDEGHCLRTQALEFCRRSTRSTDFSATSLETLRHLVVAGHGVTLIPKLATQGGPSGIRYIPFVNPGPHRRIGLACRKTSPRRILIEKAAGLLSAETAKQLAAIKE